MGILLSLLLGYCIGMVNPAYILSRLRGFDIRDRGSGNAGASNAIVMMGKAVGIVCAVFDILKAFAAYKLGGILFPWLDNAGILAGIGCILGHIFPALMGFRGGKGLACIAGVAIAYKWRLFLILLLGALVVVLSTGYIAMVTLYAYVAFPTVYWFQTGDLLGLGLLLVLTMVIFHKHRDNLRRILKNQEVRISVLWDRDKELERLKDDFPEDYENAAR